MIPIVSYQLAADISTPWLYKFTRKVKNDFLQLQLIQIDQRFDPTTTARHPFRRVINSFVLTGGRQLH